MGKSGLLKNGHTFDVTCEGASITRNNLTDMMCGYNLKGVTKNKPLFINFNEVAIVVRLGREEDK